MGRNGGKWGWGKCGRMEGVGRLGGVGSGRAHPSHSPGASRGKGGAAGFGVSKRRPPPPPSHPGFIPFPYPRSHRGSARSRSPACLALALRVTRSPCPGGTWREGESWAEVRARRQCPWGGSGQGRRNGAPTPASWPGRAPSFLALVTHLCRLHRCEDLNFCQDRRWV